jgi:L-fucose isomerase-like protein
VDDNAHITKQDWNTLVAACKEAGMRWIPSLKFIAEAVGVPVEKLDHLQITQRQYQQAMRLVEEYRRSIEKERRISEAREKIEDKWFER